MSADGPQKPTQDPNIVSLADARKRQKTVRADKGNAKANGRSGARAGYGAARPNGAGARKTAGGSPPPLKKALQYIQFILFLAVLAYFMSLCRGPT